MHFEAPLIQSFLGGFDKMDTCNQKKIERV